MAVSNQEVAVSHLIQFDYRLCKSCGICVSICNQGVLAAGQDGLPQVIKPEGCNGCQLCFYHCPDFALEVISIAGPQPGRD